MPSVSSERRRLPLSSCFCIARKLRAIAAASLALMVHHSTRFSCAFWTVELSAAGGTAGGTAGVAGEPSGVRSEVQDWTLTL